MTTPPPSRRSSTTTVGAAAPTWRTRTTRAWIPTPRARLRPKNRAHSGVNRRRRRPPRRRPRERSSSRVESSPRPFASSRATVVLRRRRATRPDIARERRLLSQPFLLLAPRATSEKLGASARIASKSLARRSRHVAKHRAWNACQHVSNFTVGGARRRRGTPRNRSRTVRAVD